MNTTAATTLPSSFILFPGEEARAMSGRTVVVAERRIVAAPCDHCGTMTRTSPRQFTWRCPDHPLR